MDENGRCRCTEDYFMSMDGICSKCGGNQTNYDLEGPCECMLGYEPDPGKNNQTLESTKAQICFQNIQKIASENVSQILCLFGGNAATSANENTWSSISMVTAFVLRAQFGTILIKTAARWSLFQTSIVSITMLKKMSARLIRSRF